MIGTSISVENSGEMQYPSITICETVQSGAPVFEDGQMFDTYDHYANWKYNMNNSLGKYHDLKDIFLSLTTNMPNMSTFILSPDDIDDRDGLSQIRHVLKKYLNDKGKLHTS